MSSRRTSRRSASQQPAFPHLPRGVQVGLARLVSDHKVTVAQMLDLTTSASSDQLCETCATVMKQQQLSVSQFLARFFDISMLQQHAETVLHKSGKGSAVVLSERIETAWIKGKPLILPALLSSKDNQKSVVQEGMVNRSSDKDGSNNNNNKEEGRAHRKRAAEAPAEPEESSTATNTNIKKPKANPHRPLKE